MQDIQLVASGERWIGYGIYPFASAIRQLMDRASDDLVMTVYIISDNEIAKSLKGALDRGVSVEIFIYDNPSLQTPMFDRILALGEEYDHVRIHALKNEVLHAKVLVTDALNVLLGSANPTFSGMVTNYELGVLVESGHIAQKILALLWRLKTK